MQTFTLKLSFPAPGFYPFFQIIDEITGNTSLYEGQYTLKVIGGSVLGEDDIEIYTDDEVQRYNSNIRCVVIHNSGSRPCLILL